MPNQESGAGKPSFGEKVKNFLIPENAAWQYKVLTGIAKVGETTLLLAGAGLAGIGLATKVLSWEEMERMIAAACYGSVTLGANIAVDGRAERKTSKKAGMQVASE